MLKECKWESRVLARGHHVSWLGMSDWPTKKEVLHRGIKASWSRFFGQCLPY